MGRSAGHPPDVADSVAAAIRAVEAAGVRGWALVGWGRGRPRLLLDGPPPRPLPDQSGASAAEAFVDGLTAPTFGERVFLLGYEASSALVKDAPRHAHDPSLGPPAWVRDFRSGLDLASGAPKPFGEGPALEAVVACGSATAGSRGNDPWAAAPLVWATAPGERARHLDRVRACREALASGVLYQANLAHRLTVQATGRAAALAAWWQMASRAPPAFAAAVDVEGWGLVLSLSPECFLTWSLPASGPRRASAFPIKGTRPRGTTPDEDRRLLDELHASPKDRAEHVMIVDLLRNDLGRVATAGGVTVSALFSTVTVPNVHHLESRIDAELRADVDLPALLRATAPGGSITGAPKSAALDVIHALEAGPRGLYTGNLGTIDAEGEGEASILIRTWLCPDDEEGALHVGGGIVTGSDPAEEWEETLAKARAFGVVEER